MYYKKQGRFAERPEKCAGRKAGTSKFCKLYLHYLHLIFCFFSGFYIGKNYMLHINCIYCPKKTPKAPLHASPKTHC